MGKKIDVSVIVATYNFDVKKTIATLNSVILQKNVSIEIIVADDGSKNTEDFDIIEAYIKKNNFEDYKIIKNKENQGTVKNLFSGIKQAVGKYVYFISPGDCLFDDCVLHDFYEFCEKNNSKLAFGDAVCYNLDDNGKANILDIPSAPERAECYSADKSLFFKKVAFLFGNFVVGPAYFREKNTTIECFKIIEKNSKFVEDNTATAVALANGITLDYFRRNTVWYEIGTGVSTSSNDKWKKILDEDFRRNYMYLDKVYSKSDAVIDAACFSWLNKTGIIGKIFNRVKHPVVFLTLRSVKKINNKKVIYSKENEKWIINMCEQKY